MEECTDPKSQEINDSKEIREALKTLATEWFDQLPKLSQEEKKELEQMKKLRNRKSDFEFALAHFEYVHTCLECKKFFK